MKQRVESALGAIALLSILVLIPISIAQLPCPTEDSVNCSWDAAKQGNGGGQSFTSFAAFGYELTIWWKQH